MIDLTKLPDPSPIFVFPVLWIGAILLFRQSLTECVGLEKGFKFKKLTTRQKVEALVWLLIWALVFAAMAFFTKEQFC